MRESPDVAALKSGDGYSLRSAKRVITARRQRHAGVLHHLAALVVWRTITHDRLLRRVYIIRFATGP